MERETPNVTWLVVKTKPRTEKKIYQQLTTAGISAFLPSYCVMRQWSDRKKKVEVPLIPGVVFVQNDLTDTYSLYDFPNVSGILKEFGKPALVTQQEVDNLQILVKEWNGETIEAHETCDFRCGDPVEVVRGNFAGIVGDLLSINGKHRLVVQLKTLNVEFTVNIPKSHVKPIKLKQPA